MRIRYLTFVATLAVCTTTSAVPPVESFQLFTGFPGDAKGQWAVDVDTSRPGIETLAISLACSASSTDANGYFKVSTTLKFKLFSADGTSTVLSPANLKATTGKVPDFRLSQFQCGGTSATSYGSISAHTNPDMPRGVPATVSNYGACAPAQTFEAENVLCDEFPNWGFGMGIAKAGGTQVLVAGTMADVSYKISGHGDVDASGFVITAYSLTDSSRIWNKTYPGTDADGFWLYPEFSLVGDFLNSDGNDEIRLAYQSDDHWKYGYLNPVDGKTLATAVIASP
ncbi:hypothetical protein [Hydrocarboniphaga sp.]|uniref:hypothetical protein n=1 Tax=Hydrocarboniphaga sp. TaxID=2033016 RepID=UPI00261B5739|nr:hypothetical protein [Hydrocarboniphaga sp.]